MVDVRMYTREGCRGGREQFTWNSLKEQDFKDREQYLGVSTKVGLMGKFARYYVHDWYAHKRDEVTKIEEEKETVQQFEEELMQEALGLKPKKLLLAKKQLSEAELKDYLTKDSEKSQEKSGRELMGPQDKMFKDANGVEMEASEFFADHGVKGLGFAAHRNAKLEKYKAETMGTESKLEGIKSEMKLEVKNEIKNEPMLDTDFVRLGGSSSSSSGLKKEEHPDASLKKEEAEVKDEPAEVPTSKRPREDDGADDEQDDPKKRRKADKKEKKKKKKAEKKAKKKVKKAAKKAKKAAKLAAAMNAGRKAASQSSSSSSSS